jgi:hypothetical protein
MLDGTRLAGAPASREGAGLEKKRERRSNGAPGGSMLEAQKPGEMLNWKCQPRWGRSMG